MGSVFKLRIISTGRTCKVFAEFNGEKKEADVDALPPTFKDYLQPLQRTILQATASVRKVPTANRPVANPENDAIRPTRAILAISASSADVKMIQEVGSALFKFVFQEEVNGLYRRARAAAPELAIRLCVEAPELSYIPWETLFDPKNRDHLCCSQATPFARAASVDEDNRIIIKQLPIRILGMVSKPKMFRGTELELSTDAEQTAIIEALKPLEQEGKVKLDWVPSGARQDLSKRLNRPDSQWDIFHFIGHGGFDRDKGQGFLALEAPDGSGWVPFYAESLRGYLDQPGGPKLVILNSCQGAELGDGDLFSSTAARLVVGNGIPAVVAMQFEISDQMAVQFSQYFYGYLAVARPVQTALTLTRLDLRADGYAEWISPVLYMQNNDGGVFRVAGSTQTGS